MHDLLDILAYRYDVGGLAASVTTIEWATVYLIGKRGLIFARDALDKLNASRARRGKMPVSWHNVRMQMPDYQDYLRTGGL